MKTILTTGWNLMRMIRLIMGIVVVIFAIRRHDMFLGLAGGFLVLMSLLNAGCCGVSGCANQKREVMKKLVKDEP